MTTRIVDVTPNMAGKMLDSLHYEHQRKLSPVHVEYLRRLMETGEFRTCSIVTAECYEDGKTYLLDGYHRLHAIVAYGKSVQLIFVEWSLEFRKQVDDLFVTIDGGKSRTVGQRIQPYIPEGLTTNRASLIASAGRFVENGFDIPTQSGYESKSPKARLDILCRWKPEYLALRQAIEGCESDTYRAFERIPVAAVMFALIRHQPEKATKFLEEIAAADKLERYSPVWQFVHKIVPMPSKSASYWRGYARTIAPIWNAYYEGRKVLTNLYPQSTDRPILLLGTPFNRKENKEK